MAENQTSTASGKSKRDLFGERLKKKYPDRDYADDEALFGQINDDNELGQYKERESRLTDLLSKDNRAAQFIADMANGNDPWLAVIERLGIDGITDLMNDPSKQEAYAEANKKYVERLAKEKSLEEEYEKNMREVTLPMLEKMKQRMGEVNWQESIATQWMQTVKTVSQKDKGLPYFMATDEWDLKNLNAALSSWAELKHDAILYAKQPFGAECGGGGPPDPVVKGYVEPNVAFWKKALELLDNTANLLTEHDMMTEKVKENTERIAEEVSFLLRMSEKELAGKELTDEEYDQLSCIGATFENISLSMLSAPDQYLMGWDDVQGADRKMAVVADVYTANANNNPQKSILFEAVGLGDEIYVVVEIGGYLYLTRGAVFSYREFIQPIDQQRLTDEEWQQELEKNPRKGVPTWMERITMPTDQKPAVNEEIFYSSGC